MVTIAKQLGIKVAEYQHGLINKNHLAYNFSNEIKERVRNYTPDEILFWGEYWSERTNISGKKVIVGYPYIEIKSLNLSHTPKKKPRVLLLSGGSIPQEYIKISYWLLKELGEENYEYIFRPHPSERIAVNERYSELFKIGYNLDNDNLYESLSKSDICISLEFSTVLYEAVFFCKKVVLLLSQQSSLYIEDDELPFIVLSDINQLDNILSAENSYTVKEWRYKLFYPAYKEALKQWKCTI